MSHVTRKAQECLRGLISEAFLAEVESRKIQLENPTNAIPNFALELPADRSHGDWACNIAMMSAKIMRAAPIQIATAIKESINLEGTYFKRCEVAGPGFLNFYYNEQFYCDVTRDVLTLKEKYGHSEYGKSEKVMVEFVSANPTGPMHMGNARGGALGDCLASVLEVAGYSVWREFYVNDAGNQLEKFGLSIDIRYRQLFEGSRAPELPEDSYHGEDITALAKQYAEIHGDHLMAIDEPTRRKTLVEFALPQNITRMQEDLKKYGINYDKWFYESELYKNGEVSAIIASLKDKGHTYESEDATWFRATDWGLEKDEVLVRNNGNPTYFAVDIAYHCNKLNRGFTWLIDILGADHHGHVARLKSAINAARAGSVKLDIILMQLVHLVRDGQAVRMSKRTGKAIQLNDLLDEVSTDAARFLFNMRESGSQMEFDLDLAVKQDSQNPVYYVQYAYARISSIIKNLSDDGVLRRDCSDDELKLLSSPDEIELKHHISAYTDEIIIAAQKLDPARITKYVINLATLFHKFYNTCRVKGEEEPLMQARLALCFATQTVIHNVLSMFQISAPDKM